MAEEEFQESDVVFRDMEEDEFEIAADPALAASPADQFRKPMERSSVPVNIPVSAPWNVSVRCADDVGDDGEMVPPHVIIGRRVARKMVTLSVCGGIMKGKDLSEFRDLILRMTGFLET